jgi:type IV pilus assembly protein PilC
MAYLLYSALSREGQNIRRLGNYPALQDLDKELSLHGEELVDYHLLSDGIGRLLESLRGKPGPLEIAEFCTTLSHYVAGGIELQGALSDAAKSSSSSSMRSAIIDIRRHLKGGFSLSEGMRKTGRFPDVVISMSKIGEESGNLARMLRDAAQHLERVEEIKGAAKRAMIYPAFTFLVVCAAGGFWMTAVVPKIVQLFEAMQVELEPATLMLIAASDFFSAYWPLMLATVVAIPVSWMLARRNARFRIASDHLLWRLPLVGRIVQGSQMAFYYQYLSLMYGAGVVITNALDTMQQTVSNKYFGLRVSTLLTDLRSGSMLGDAFRECELFPLLDQRMVSIGEQTGNLEEQLDKLAEIHFTRVTSLVEVLPKFVEPVMLLVLGGGFAFFIVALMGPLYSMISNVGGM